MSWKIRPFEEFVRRGEGRPAWVIKGGIEGAVFVLSVHGHRILLDTERTGHDDLGPFALVEDGEFSLPDGFRVELYQEDEDADSLALYIFRNVEAKTKAEADARKLGVDPAQVNLLVPPEQSHRIYFNLNGLRSVSSFVRSEPSTEKPLN